MLIGNEIMRERRTLARAIKQDRFMFWFLVVVSSAAFVAFGFCVAAGIQLIG